MSDSSPLQALFESQAATALRWRSATANQRRTRIRRLRDAVLERREAIYAAAREDFGKPPTEVDLTELMPVISEANQALRHLRAWMRPRRVWPTLAMFGTASQVQFQPRGRCLILSPWNYALNLSLGPVISALAAGNTVILKPSELSPALSGVVAELLRATFEPDEVAVVEGDAAVSQALLALPFDHIFFTGSTAVGRKVMAAAAQHLSSVTLELGGKSPTVVDASADLAQAAATLCWAKFTNAGQTCIAPDHIHVHEGVFDAFVGKLREQLDRAYGADADRRRQTPDYARIVNDRHFQRLKGLMDDAVVRGAQLLEGGETDPQTRYIAPTLLTHLSEHTALAQEEIFGPLLPLLPYRSTEEVIQRINAQPKPLALYIWAKHAPTIRELTQRTSSGGVCINQAVVQFAHGHLPFGGVNQSGLGNSHGWYGFRAFSHERAVLRGRINLIRWFFPPFTTLSRRLAHWLLRLA